MESWEEFEALARAWAEDGPTDPRLPTTPEEFLSLGYEKWLSLPAIGGQRRTLDVFEARLTRLHPGGSVPSLYRKVKGAIRPKDDELRRLLTVLFARSDGDEVSAAAREDAARLAGALAERLSNRTPDLVESTADAYIFASQGRLILGPDDPTRDETFRELMSNRLNAARAALGSAAPARVPAIPLTLWLMDISEPARDAAAVFEARRELMTLASGLIAALATDLNPPPVPPSLEFSEGKAASLATDIRIARRSRQDRGNKADLRKALVHTSVICLIGPKPETDPGRSELQIEGDFDGSLFSRALMPPAVVNKETLRESVADRVADRILAQMDRRRVCLGVKIGPDLVQEVSAAASADLDQLDGLQQRFSIYPRYYVFWEDRPLGEKTASVSEQILQRVETNAAIRTAIFALLTGASVRLGEAFGGKRYEEGTIGYEVKMLLERHGVRILTVDEFLDFKQWSGIEPGLFLRVDPSDKET